MAKLITLERLKAFLTKLDSRFQKALKFDTTPTANSKNPVTSGGVKTYVDNVAAGKANTTDIVQADWNQTSTGSNAYIKNKPTTWSTDKLTRPASRNGIDQVSRPLLNSARSNRLAFLPADQIIIEQTVDGGTTWTSAGVSDAAKRHLFDETRSGGVALPRIDGNQNALCGIRITITAMKYNVPSGTAETDKYKYWNKTYVKSTERYCTLDTFYFWLCAISNKITVTIERATGDNPDSWNTAFKNTGFGMTGWSGGNTVTCGSQVFGGFTYQTGQFWNYRFTFMTTGPNNTSTLNAGYLTSAQSISGIYGWGENVWAYPNNLMNIDHIYSWDTDQNVTFPGKVKAAGFTGNADTATKATQDASGNVITSTYATKTEVAKKQGTLTFDTAPTSGSTNPVTSGGVYDALGPSLFLSDQDTGEWVGLPIRSKSGIVLSDTEPSDHDVIWLKEV